MTGLCCYFYAIIGEMHKQLQVEIPEGTEKTQYISNIHSGMKAEYDVLDSSNLHV